MKRPLYFSLGLTAMALAVLGAVLPIMPTVPFLIVAAFAFSRSHPEWAERLHNHPQYGEPLRNWRDRRAIGRKAKVLSIGGMALGVGFTALTIGFPFMLISLAILLLVGPWIWTRPE